MKLSGWRIVHERHTAQAFSGEGARLYGGRWNSAGVAVVYTAGSRALAALEMLVHLDSPRVLKRYVLRRVEFDERLLRKLEPGEIPSDWRENPPPRSTQAIGDKWIKGAGSAVFRVPSVVVPEEWNYLLNPAHPDFDKVEIAEPAKFDFDPRLGRG
ncbi:RES family NAD+ phosphorylase [Occallatibacter riparius]|uniref:RES family NAD+ phosphorylase n=1 Tax=Occallatibacter riparius TaxID=1002689 RepID=A0A9J7BHG0_9BACT|nr:RES family NAD+ phosphorylase [Occallatibacter riparius]UWZ82159.1 RES family NAD+ phosphorylase [Occallatibacter riparius]